MPRLRRVRAARQQLEIFVLGLLVAVLRAARRLRGFAQRPVLGRHPRATWLATAAVVAVAGLVLTIAVVPRSSARSASAQSRPQSTASPPLSEPTPPALSPDAFAAAAHRAPAAAPIRRLPQVDLNGLSVAGIPPAALAAYVTAARRTDRADSSCRLRWWLLAGIGLVESGHARSGGSARPHWNGIARPPIYGPRLDGSHGFAAIRDTDRGVLDGDKGWDRAVGPMQFLPSTWRRWGGTEARGRMRDPQDVRAAALAAAGYLCAGSADLSQPEGMATAVYSYNHSFDYVRLVLSVAAKYAGLNPDALGVNRLPHDKPAKKKHPKRKSGSAAPSSKASTASASPSPSANQAPPSPQPTPSASPSGPSLPPLPTPSAGGI